MQKKLTRGQAIRLHRRLWRWLSENPSAYKHHWPGWKENGGKYDYAVARCFLCELTKGHLNQCLICPLKWPGPNGNCNPLFNNWDSTDSDSERSQLALEISKLPVRKIGKGK